MFPTIAAIPFDDELKTSNVKRKADSGRLFACVVRNACRTLLALRGLKMISNLEKDFAFEEFLYNLCNLDNAQTPSIHENIRKRGHSAI